MSTEFRSVEEARDYVRVYLHLGPEVSFEEIETEPVGNPILFLTEDSENLQKITNGLRNAQKTFRLIEKGQERLFQYEDQNHQKRECKLRFTIGPFREGFDCWVINEESGAAMRL